MTPWLLPNFDFEALQLHMKTNIPGRLQSPKVLLPFAFLVCVLLGVLGGYGWKRKGKADEIANCERGCTAGIVVAYGRHLPAEQLYCAEYCKCAVGEKLGDRAKERDQCTQRASEVSRLPELPAEHW